MQDDLLGGKNSDVLDLKVGAQRGSRRPAAAPGSSAACRCPASLRPAPLPPRPQRRPWVSFPDKAAPATPSCSAGCFEAEGALPLQPGWPDTTLVISHSSAWPSTQRRTGPEASKLLELEVIHIDLGCYETQNGCANSITQGCSHFTKLKMPGSERMFSVSSCLCPPARSRMNWLCSGALMGRPAQESSTAGNCRKSPSSRNFTSALPHAGQVRPERHVQLRDLHHQPVQLLRAYLRTQWSAVCAPRPRFCAEQCVLDPSPALAASPQLSGQVRLSGGGPVSSRELPPGSGPRGLFRCLGRSASMHSALLLPSDGFVSSTRRTGVPSGWRSASAPEAAPRSVLLVVASAGSPSSRAR